MRIDWMVKAGAAALLAGAAGCVPLSEYRKLEQRFHEQEQYVVENKDRLRAMEKNEQALLLKARQREREKEMLRTRLEKSERLRERLVARLRAQPTAVPASSPKVEDAPKVMGLEVNPETHGLVLESGLLFGPGSATLTARGKQVLGRLRAELQKPEYADQLISVEGHTDAAPIKRSKHKSNWDLSAKRALAVLHYLEKQGISPQRLAFAGFGPYRPLDEGKSKQSFARNRRVEIVLYRR